MRRCRYERHLLAIASPRLPEACSRYEMVPIYFFTIRFLRRTSWLLQDMPLFLRPICSHLLHTKLWKAFLPMEVCIFACVPGSRIMYSTRYMVPGTWYKVPGTRHLVPGTWYQVTGTRYLVLGTRYLVPGTWHLVPGLAPGTKYSVPGTWYLVPRACYLEPGTWYYSLLFRTIQHYLALMATSGL